MISRYFLIKTSINALIKKKECKASSANKVTANKENFLYKVWSLISKRPLLFLLHSRRLNVARKVLFLQKFWTVHSSNSPNVTTLLTNGVAKRFRRGFYDSDLSTDCLRNVICYIGIAVASAHYNLRRLPRIRIECRGFSRNESREWNAGTIFLHPSCIYSFIH